MGQRCGSCREIDLTPGLYRSRTTKPAANRPVANSEGGASNLVSSFECNVRSEGREFFGHGFFGCFPSKGLAGSLVYQAGDVVEFGLTDGAQVGALGEELAQQTVGVLVAAARPAGMRITKSDVCFQPSSQLRVASHLAATVVSHGPAQHSRQAFHLAGEAFQRRFGSAAAHFAENEKACLALDHRAHGRAVEGPLDQIAFPMTGHQTALDLRVGG
jgi:hypothetical protein